MRIAQIACATKTGLGLQGKSFYDNMHPDYVMVVDISELNGAEQHPEWYPNAYTAKGLMLDDDIRKFIDSRDIDVIFVTESAYSFYLYDYAHYRGIKVICEENWEFFDWQGNPQLPHPDAFIAPSTWHYDDLKRVCDENGWMCTHIQHPVDRTKFPFRKISHAKTFIHSAGRSAAHDRAGTYSVIEATKHLKSDAKVIIHFQGEQGLAHQLTSTTQDYIDYADQFGDMSKIEFLFKDFADASDIYKLGDIYIQPRRYGGNNLPMGEALSSGLPVVMTDISPNNQFLPKGWLVSACKKDQFTPRTVIDIYEANARDLAARIDKFARMNPKKMLFENKRANELAESISWMVMKPKYQAFFEEVINRPNS